MILEKYPFLRKTKEEEEEEQEEEEEEKEVEEEEENEGERGIVVTFPRSPIWQIPTQRSFEVNTHSKFQYVS